MRERDINRKLFHKGHYNVIAARFREELSKYELTTDEHGNVHYSVEALTGLAVSLAKRLQLDNEEFLPLKFLEACSPDLDVYDLREYWTE